MNGLLPIMNKIYKQLISVQLWGRAVHAASVYMSDSRRPPSTAERHPRRSGVRPAGHRALGDGLRRSPAPSHRLAPTGQQACLDLQPPRMVDLMLDTSG